MGCVWPSFCKLETLKTGFLSNPHLPKFCLSVSSSSFYNSSFSYSSHRTIYDIYMEFTPCSYQLNSLVLWLNGPTSWLHSISCCCIACFKCHCLSNHLSHVSLLSHNRIKAQGKKFLQPPMLLLVFMLHQALWSRYFQSKQP